MADDITPPSPRNSLLDELESIIDVLEDQQADNIPVLDEVVNHNSNSTSSLLDMEDIFGPDNNERTALDTDDTPSLNEPSKYYLGMPEPEPDMLQPTHPEELTDTSDNIDTLIDDIEESPALNQEASPATKLRCDQTTDMFNEAATASATEPPSNTQPTPLTSHSDLNLDLLIQEIVDEFVPVIEDELRQRLNQCEPELVRQLAKKYLE